MCRRGIPYHNATDVFGLSCLLAKLSKDQGPGEKRDEIELISDAMVENFQSSMSKNHRKFSNFALDFSRSQKHDLE